MDKRESNKNQSFQDDHQFLHDEEFIRWRLFRTKESDAYWDDFLTKNPHLEKALQEAIMQFNAVKINRDRLPEEEKEEIYRTVLTDINRYKGRRLLRRIGSIAAILVIGMLSVLFFARKEDKEPVAAGGCAFILGQTLPDEEIYLISGEEKINIAHKSHISLTEDGKASVTDSTDASRELRLATAGLNKLIVPYGKRTNLTLTDGTEVWLNSGTELDFPSEFAGDKREIYVNGEIFIDVAHDPETPFVVRVQDMEILVYGTSFNVSAYRDDDKKTIVLVNGKVKVETGNGRTTELLPNEKMEIAGNDMTKESVNVSAYISWTKGILEFNETSISEILKKIGRYYNVRFEHSTDVALNNKTCSGKLFLSNNLDSVMISVSALSSTVYERENSIIHITKKQMPVRK